MKLGYIILILSVNLMGCGNSNQTKDLVESIQYESFGRRSTFKFNMDKEKIRIQKTGLDSYEIEAKTLGADWEKVMALLSQVNIPGLGDIEVPSTLHTSDRAPSGQLQITSNGKTYGTPTFDDNNPPESLVKLIDGIYGISDKVGR